MTHPEPASDSAISDLERLMLEAREAQAVNPVAEVSAKKPGLLIWTIIAAALVLTSIGLHFFWPAS